MQFEAHWLLLALILARKLSLLRKLNIWSWPRIQFNCKRLSKTSIFQKKTGSFRKKVLHCGLCGYILIYIHKYYFPNIFRTDTITIDRNGYKKLVDDTVKLQAALQKIKFLERSMEEKDESTSDLNSVNEYIELYPCAIKWLAAASHDCGWLWLLVDW